MSSQTDNQAPTKVLVTGVSGFVGKALATKLLSLGYSVVGISRSDPAIQGLEFFPVDLSAPGDALHAALTGVSAVFHTAAKVDMWGPYDEFYRVNVLGTKYLLEAAQEKKVSSFIFTSSPSVIAGEDSLCGVNESVPYPETYSANYPKTKAEAERLVLSAASETFFTCSLRPHLIYGKGDRNFAPLVIARAKSGRLRQIGDGKNLVDFSHIDDCVASHIYALKTLQENPSRCSGKAYFISQGEPYPLWQWIRELLALQSPPITLPSKAVPPALAYGIATIMELASKITNYKLKPLLTNFLIHQMTTSHYFDITAAEKDIGYTPSISVKEGLLR